MSLFKVLNTFIPHHGKTQRNSNGDKTPPTLPMGSTTAVEPAPPAEVHHHSFLHKLVLQLEKGEQRESHKKQKPRRQRYRDPVYLHHAVSASDLTTKVGPKVSTSTQEEAHTLTSPHHSSTPIEKGWVKAKIVAHNHHEAANESFIAYYSAMTDRVPPTAPEQKTIVSAMTLEEYSAPETREHAIKRLGAMERKRHHREHTMGHGVAAI